MRNFSSLFLPCLIVCSFIFLSCVLDEDDSDYSPDAVVSLTLSLNFDGSVTLAWMKQDDEKISKYVIDVYQTEPEEKFTTIECSAPAVSCIVTGLVSGTEYKFSVMSYGDGHYSNSRSVTATPLDITPPEEVSNISCMLWNNSVVHISWTNPDDIDFSAVYLSITGENTSVSEELDKDVSEFSIDSLNLPSQYAFFITTVDIYGNVSSGKTVYFIPKELSVYKEVENFSYVTNKDKSVTVSWKAPLEITGVVVLLYNLTDDTLLYESGELSSETVDFTIPASYLNEKKTYKIKIYTISLEGNYSSGVLYYVIPNDVTAPSEVSNVSYATNSYGSVSITWTNPSDDDFAGLILSIANSNETEIVSAILENAETEYSVSALSESISYKAVIKTFDFTGNYSDGIEFSFIPDDVTPPSPVTDLSYEVQDDGSVIFSWTNPTDSDFESLYVELFPATDSFENETLESDKNSITIFNFLRQTVYKIYLTACDSSGNKSENASIKYMLPVDHEEDEWFTNNPVTAHAGGGMTDGENNYIYTNSKESIISHYEAGFRLFEVDLDFTVYLTPVLCHDWDSFCSMTGLTSTDVTLEQFKNASIYGLYTPTTLEDLVELMIQHDDMYVDIDSKERSPSVWVPALVSYCELNDALDVLDRIIVEFYDEENYEEIDSLYHFKNYFYTDYLLNSGNALSEEQHQLVIEFLIRKNIPYYETNDSNITQALVSHYHSYGIKVIAWGNKSHSVTNFKTLKTMGVDAIQSDWVTNDMWNEN